MTKYILEHCDEELYEWSFLEYKHISEIVGKENLIFYNVSEEKLKPFGEVHPESVTTVDLKKACILDPLAEKTLSPEDVNNFDQFIFGGILGDDPPTEKTRNLITSKVKWEARNLGKEQMATDNAVFVVKKILEGTSLEKIPFKQEIVIPIAEGEEVILPFKYVLVDGKPLVCDALIHKLKTQEGF